MRSSALSVSQKQSDHDSTSLQSFESISRSHVNLDKKTEFSDDDDDDHDYHNRDGNVEERALLGSNYKKKSTILSAFKNRNELKRLLFFLMALMIAVIIFFIEDIFKNDPPARRCLSLFAFVATLWATEALPLHITSLLTPILIVTMKVLKDSSGQVKSGPDAAKEVMGSLFSGTVLVALGAFTMSKALSKYNISYRLGMFVLTKAGKRPPVVMLAVMFLGLFLSMWMNNVASPVVVMSIVKPLLDEMPVTEPFAKVLLLGIAYSNNIGGMISPISSPQNLVAINAIDHETWTEYLDDGTTIIKKSSIGWGKFLSVSVPFSVACNIVAFGFLWLAFRPKLKQVASIPPKVLEPFGIKHTFVITISVATVTLWAIQKEISWFFGHVGIIALIPVVLFFTFPILDKSEFRELSWEVLMLLAGGIALGEAIQSSGLLAIMAHTLGTIVSGSSLYVSLAAFAGFIWIFGNFISHTVAAIIVLPVIAKVGCHLGGGNCSVGHFELLVLGSVFMDSGAMGLPVASFPNAQCYSMRDRDGNPYLTAFDFVKTGFLLGLLELALLLSLGYGLLHAVF